MKIAVGDSAGRFAKLKRELFTSLIRIKRETITKMPANSQIFLCGPCRRLPTEKTVYEIKNKGIKFDHPHVQMKNMETNNNHKFWALRLRQ
jgi:hypothetical protein